MKNKYYFRIAIISLLVVLYACKKETASVPLQFEDYCASVHRNAPLSLSKALVEVKDKMKKKTGVYVLEDGGFSLVTRAWFTSYAEKSIDIQYFIFSTDNVGLIACDYLVRAADRGVKVRLLVDDFLVRARIEDILALNSHKNIQIKVYNPGVNLGAPLYKKVKKFATDFRGANQRMHNKVFMVDEKLVITGGRNIADEYFDYDHEYNFRDRDVLLSGNVVPDVKTSFEGFWNSSLSVSVEKLLQSETTAAYGEDVFDNLHQYACNPANFWPKVRENIDRFPVIFQNILTGGGIEWVDTVSYISDMPGKNDGSQGLGGSGVCTDALIEMVKKAKHSIDIQTPYLVTTELAQDLFKAAVDRGVKIRILTNSLLSTDNVEAFSSYQSSRKELLKTGVEVYEFRPDAEERMRIMTGELHKAVDNLPVFGLHAKSMIIDGKITVIGTFNLDPRSANLNTECIAVIHSENITKKVAAGMEVEFAPENSWHITRDFNPDSKVKTSKRVKTWSRKVLPKSIL